MEKVVIRAEWLQAIARQNRSMAVGVANLVVPTLEQPFEVWLTPYADGSYRKRYLALFQGVEKLLMIVRENVDGSLFWEAYDSSNWRWLNDLRQGTLLFGRGNGGS